jgi:pimeloyl-ACP methyl ester carboxylesterase
VIFLHGYSDSWKSFLPIIPYLPKSIHGYFLSQRGHGNSSKPVKGYRPEDFASDVSGFMRAMNIKSAIIVGHSMGGTVAQRFALDFPESTKALVLIGSFPSFTQNAAVKELCQYIDGMGTLVDTGFVREFQKSTIYKPVPASYFDIVVSESMKVPAHTWKGVSNELLRTDLTTELAGITKPTLIIYGSKDNVCLRQDQKVFLSLISTSVLKEYEHIGHAVHWEDPERFTNDLIKFVQEMK